MAHDASFLAKCEQFLLHPRVRALSLAQRVDFLENKGLSPEEITAILKNVERQNGLSRMLLDSAGDVARASSTAAATSSLWGLLRSYGLATAATLVLAYGYVRLRQRLVLQLMAAQRNAALERRQKRQMAVVETLRYVADQRKQFEQVLTRVKNRVTRLEVLKSTEGSEEDFTAMAEHRRREQEVRALQEQVAMLKATVLQTYKAKVERQVQDEAVVRRDTSPEETIAEETRVEKPGPALLIA